MKKLLLFVSVLLFSQNLFSQVTLLTPNGGEVWLAGSTQTVSWTDVNPTGYVNLDYSSDNGGTWNRIVSSANSMNPTYQWWTPTFAATTYKVKVTDVNNFLNFDESNAPFTITDKLPSTLTLTYPNGGEIIYSGSQQNITWISSNIGSVNLYFSPDNGLTWNSIATNLPAYMESYSSIVTSGSTNNAIIKISDASDVATFDESNGVFTILDTTKHKITLSLPNGGENWQVGSNQYIAWTNTNMTGNVNIDYSTDNGTTWLSVAANLPSMNPTYMWTVPNTPSTSCKIKVYDASDTSVFDESDAVFTIQRLEQFTEQTSISLLGLGLSSVAWGDYNNDGYLDILLTGRNDASHPYTIIYKNNGDGTFTEQTNATLTSASSGSAAWGDYDNDGYLDVLLTGYTISGPVSQIYKNNGDGTFTLLISTSLPGVGNSSVAWGDYDNDGKLDVLLTGNSFGTRISKIYKNNGNETFTEQTSVSLTGVSNSSVAWGDYDNDGNLDILLTGLSDVSGQVSIIYRNNGDGTFTEQTSVFLAGVEQGSVAWGDYDNDGYLDILLTGINGTNQISKIYKNTGAGTFTEQTSASLTGVSNSSVAWGDYNNDGLLDILLTGYEINNNPISKIYKNMGEGIFYEQTSASLIGVGNSSVVWGDYDNDGALDILLTGYATGSGYVSKIYKNITAVFNTASTAPTNLTSSVSGNDVSFNWNKSFDQETPQNGLSYNLLIGTTLESVDVLSPMANKTNGFRRIVKHGNNQTNSWTIKNLPGGTYLWSVQAIDAAFTGSPFASQEVFTVGEITNTLLLLSPNGGENLVTGTVDTIHWSGNYLTQVKLDYTTDYGATWMNIAGSMPAEYPDGYAWVVPNTPSTICKVRVSDINDPTMVDESDNVFTINSGNGFDSIFYGEKIYHIVKIGTQTWLKENLDIGTMILGTENPSNNSIIEKYCYDNNPVNCDTYGGLYQWNEVMAYSTTSGTQGICPTSWHIPSDAELQTLMASVGNDGNALKAIGQGTGSGAGTNTSGFSALFAGQRNLDGTFYDLGEYTYVWSSTEYSAPYAYYLYLTFNGSSIYLGNYYKEDGFSIRCLKDESITNFIQVASPNGGEYFTSGTVDTIRWSANSTTQVKIDYTTNNGDTWMNIAGGIYSMYPAYAWTVPSTPSTTCKVRVTDNSNPNDFDESDNVFTIAPQMFTDLVAYYPFIDGTLGDFSGNGNTASNFGGQLVADRFGKPNNAYHFNGDAYMSVPNSPSLQSPTNMVTLSGWVKNDVGSIYAVAVKSASSGLGQYRLYLTDYSVVFSSSIVFDASMPFTFEQGKWYFVAVSWDGNNINYFVNGNFIGSAPSVGTLTPDSEPLVWGMDTPGMTEYTNGTLDDIRIYNRALPTAEIRELYHEGGWDIHMVDSGLVAYYPFNNNTIDESGNGNNGTNNGATPGFDRFNNPNSALSFDGNTNFVLVPSSSSLNVQNSITLSAWIKTDNPHIIQDVNPGAILAKHETVQTRQYDLFFYSTTYDSLHFDLVDQRDNFSSDEYFFATSTPSASYRNNQWHMVVGTYDYNTGFSHIYIDGVLSTSNYIGQIDLMKSNVPLTIGCYSEQNSNFRGFYQGIIDDIRIYDRSLSQQEIMMLFYEKEYVPTSLTLTTPAGGEVFQANSLVPIEWSASNVFNFSLEFTSNNGASWSLICDTLTSASTGFLWYTPYIESDLVRVRISDKNNPALFDESDSNFTVTNKITQFIPLYYSGWNMTSFYVQPLSSLPRDVFPSPPVLQVKTELQSFDPSLPEFLNTLKSVDAAQGYLVKVDAAESYFEVTGLPFYPADGLNYRAGWNLMSYYYSYGESVWYAFEPIMTSVEEIKTLTSYYNPLGSPETNTLYTLEPGEAYWLRLKNNIDSYVLPSPGTILPKKHQTIGQKLMADLPWKLKGYTQSTVAIFTVTSNGEPVNAGSVVAAFVNNECRAISEVKLNSEGTAFATLVINGDKEEEVSFKIFDAVKKEAFGSNLKLKTKPGTTIPGIQELPFTFVTGVEDPILPTTTTLMNAYPNPFNPETRIRYELNKDQHVSLKIYDVLGKEVITLVDDTKNAGYYEVSFDASGLPSGIYFYRMQSGEYVSVKKLLLLK